MMIAGWENTRNQKAAREEASLALGIPVNGLEDPEHHAAVVRYAAAKFSPELLRNRLSDLCGWVRFGWAWLGSIIQGGVLLGVIWYAATDNSAVSVYAWWVIAIAVFFSLTGVLFSF